VGGWGIRQFIIECASSLYGRKVLFCEFKKKQTLQNLKRYRFGALTRVHRTIFITVSAQ